VLDLCIAGGLPALNLLCRRGLILHSGELILLVLNLCAADGLILSSPPRHSRLVPTLILEEPVIHAGEDGI
jgi:hypothetical protein